MYNKKPIFVTFEGIEGSGKSYQSRKLYNKLKKLKIPIIITREPGGSASAEKIRNIILTGSKNKFSKKTDTLLYLASRNEHIEKTINIALEKKKNIICDRFVDSTFAYQVYGKGVKESLVQNVHKHILGKAKPDLTFLLTVNLKIAFSRINKRKIINRYDKFSKNFYNKVQKGFLAIAKKNKKRYIVIDNSSDSKKVESIIFKKFLSLKKK
jgi:dTMP kinase